MLLAFLAVPTAFFMPIFLRTADPELIAAILVAHVYVNYLSLIVQFGFAWNGPAKVAEYHLDHRFTYGYWRLSIRTKLYVFGLGASLFTGFIILGENYYLLIYCIAIFSQAVNSNWLLQAQSRYFFGALFSFIGVVVGFGLIIIQGYYSLNSNYQGALIILSLLMPQIAVGICTYYVVKKFYATNLIEQFIPVKKFAKNNIYFIVSQLVLLLSASFGTVAVGMFADVKITTAYAATEKLFNLLANGIVGIFLGIYPQLAKAFNSSTQLYIVYIKRIVFSVAILFTIASLIFYFAGNYVFNLYLGAELYGIAKPILIPFTIWLMICIAQHILTAHLVLIERQSRVLLLQLLMLLITGVSGFLAMQIDPLYWVYGMICGQLFAVFALGKIYLKFRFFAHH